MVPPTDAVGADLTLCLQRYHADPADPEFGSERAPGRTTIVSPMWFLRNAQLCAASFAEQTLLPDFGWPMFGGLSLILVVWTGIGVMLSGRFDLGEMITLILFMGFAAMIMLSYTDTPVIWGTDPLPVLISGFGQSVADTFVTNVFEGFATAFQNNYDLALRGMAKAEGVEFTVQALEDMDALERAEAFRGTTDCFECGAPAPARRLFSLVFMIISLLILILGTVPVLIAYFSYLWAQRSPHFAM